MDIPKDWAQDDIYRAPIVADTLEQLAARISQWNSSHTSIVRTWMPGPAGDISSLLVGVPLKTRYQVARVMPSRSPIIDGYFECIQLAEDLRGGVDPRPVIAEFVAAELAHDPIARLRSFYGRETPEEHVRDGRFNYIDYGAFDSGSEAIGFGLFAQDHEHAGGNYIWVWSRFVHFHK